MTQTKAVRDLGPGATEVQPLTPTKAVFDLGSGATEVQPLTPQDIADLEALQPTLAQAKRMRRDAVDRERDGRMAAGVPHTFPDAVAGTIDTRNANDASNILGLVALAQRLIATAPDTVFASFRDAEDSEHALTPAEMLELYDVVVARRTALYRRAWTLKDAIAAAGDMATLDAIDITADWPA